MNAKPKPAPVIPERVAKLAREVFGSEEKAERWFASPVRALGMATPLSQMSSKAGVLRVEQVLGRIAYGVYS